LEEDREDLAAQLADEYLDEAAGVVRSTQS